MISSFSGIKTKITDKRQKLNFSYFLNKLFSDFADCWWMMMIRFRVFDDCWLLIFFTKIGGKPINYLWFLWCLPTYHYSLSVFSWLFLNWPDPEFWKKSEVWLWLWPDKGPISSENGTSEWNFAGRQII